MASRATRVPARGDGVEADAVDAPRRTRLTAPRTGRKNCRDFDSIESRGKRQGYSSLEAFANDVRRCFQNAHAWRTRCDDLVRVGSMDANTLAIAASLGVASCGGAFTPSTRLVSIF